MARRFPRNLMSTSSPRGDRVVGIIRDIAVLGGLDVILYFVVCSFVRGTVVENS